MTDWIQAPWVRKKTKMNPSMSPKSNPSSHHNPPQHSVPCQYETERPSPCSVFFPAPPESVTDPSCASPEAFHSASFISCHYHLSYLDNATEVLLHSLLIRGSPAPSRLPPPASPPLRELALPLHKSLPNLPFIQQMFPHPRLGS